MLTACVTGHRPADLFGYGLMDAKWLAVRSAIKKALLDNGVTELITGMALGVDQVAALAVLDLKDAGHAIKLHAAVPCRGHSYRWPEKSRMLYDAILSKCDQVALVSDQLYAPYLMQKRNEYMVDRSGLVIAVFKGTPGGTKNCVDYAIRKNKKIWLIPPYAPETAHFMGQPIQSESNKAK